MVFCSLDLLLSLPNAQKLGKWCQFDVIMIRDSSRMRFAATLPRVFRGTHVGDSLVTVARARSVRIEAAGPLALYADGDPIAQLPTEIRVLPAAVRVLLPA